MKNLLKIGIAAAFGVAALAGATNGVRLNSELSYESPVVEQKRARGWFDPLPNLLGLGETTFSASKLLLYEYTFTPFTSQYYEIEAASTDRTFLCVKNDVTEIYDGDDAGPAYGDENAKILFYGVAFQSYRVIVARDGSLNPAMTANITFKVRKAESVAIINDSVPHLNEYNNQVFNHNVKYEHTTYHDLTEYSIPDYLNKELVFVNAHAVCENGVLNPNKLETVESWFFNGGLEISHIPDDMRTTRLAIWDADCSYNFALNSVMNGARSAVGFDVSGYDEIQTAHEFCKMFYRELCDRPYESVWSIFNYVKNYINNNSYHPLGNNVYFYGDRNFKLFSATESNHAFDLTKRFLSPLPTIGEFQK